MRGQSTEEFKDPYGRADGQEPKPRCVDGVVLSPEIAGDTVHV